MLLNDTINFRNSAALLFLGSTAGDFATPFDAACQRVVLFDNMAGPAVFANEHNEMLIPASNDFVRLRAGMPDQRNWTSNAMPWNALHSM
jgi:hypothetical protein